MLLVILVGLLRRGVRQGVGRGCFFLFWVVLVEKTDSGPFEDEYKYVRECCIDSITNGEAVEAVDRGD